VTVVVPTRDRPEQLTRCLRSVSAALRDGDELIVVDSASIDAVAVAGVAQAAGARLVRCERPGVDRARNAGWRAGAHDVVLFTDDDVVVDVGWADALAASVLAHPDAGFVTGRILASPSDVVVPASPGASGRAGRWSRDVAIKREEQAEVYDASSVGNLGHSASVGIHRSVLERLGGWDEALGVGGALRSAPEADLFDRCFALGFAGRYEPGALAFHEQWRGPRRLILLDMRYGFGNGARLAKLVRTDRPRAWIVARHAAGSWGAADVWRGLKWRDASRVLAACVRMLATMAGFVRGISVPIVDGHFRMRSE
jgi:glycosyltransferase involved in cell wall biosynthesis